MLISLLPALAQKSGLSYQGKLTDGATPPTGNFEMQFKLFNTAEVGTGVQQGNTITQSSIAVVSGEFIVDLDFGLTVFDGSPRFLEISVKRSTESGDPVILVPRQSIAPVPYALRSLSASTVDGIEGLLSTNLTSTSKLGIGTSDPKGALHVANGGIAVTGASSPYRGAGPGVFIDAYESAGFLWSYDYVQNRPKNLIINSPGGFVGIGTADPKCRLTVATYKGGFNSYGIEHTDSDVRLSSYAGFGYGGWGTRSEHPLIFYVNDGGPSLTIDVTGNIVMTPNGGSGGYGKTTFGSPNGESGMMIQGGNRADVRFDGSTLKLVAGSGTSTPASTSGIAVTRAGNVGIGTLTPLAKLDVIGAVRTCELIVTGGCDLAEPFLMSGDFLEKGTVVVIDDERPGYLKRSANAYDTRVAGIVSGAGGVNVGIALQQDGVIGGGQNVSLSGRVYVKADATYGSIKPGDLLTSSETFGHAMKVSDHGRAQGAILGKAMGRLDHGRGLVLVLITLQ